MDSNLPAGLPSDFLDEKEMKMKICPECNGFKKEIYQRFDRMSFGHDCPVCKGIGKIEISQEELREEKEEQNEPDDL